VCIVEGALGRGVTVLAPDARGVGNPKAVVAISADEST
jgi:hypothetical protein